MIIRVRRTLIFLRRVLLQLRHQPFDRFFELRVAAGSPRGRVHLDLDVGRDADVLDFPVAVQNRRPPRSVRVTLPPSISVGIPADADQPAPSPFADQRADLQLFEEPRHRVAARAGTAR